MAHLLFSYGTLQLPAVQVATFGHELVGQPDTVVGHVLGEVRIEDPHVVAVSGSAVHPMLLATDEPGPGVEGTVFTLEDTELAAADEYEVDAYHRVAVPLASGRSAWVYALAPVEVGDEADRVGGDVDYGRFGSSYSSYRQPEPAIEQVVWDALGPAHTVLNVGAGAGSYEPVDRDVTPVEPSASMRRQRPAWRAAALDTVAERLPFADGSFDAAMTTFSVHQWPDVAAGLREVRRVTRGPVVVLTSDPTLLDRFWLVDYAPEVIATEARRYPPVERLVEALGGAEVTSVPIPLRCADGFGEAYYGRPEVLLESGARVANSAWSFVGDDVQERFAADLGRDLADGTWDARHGHLRTQPTFDGSLVLVVSSG